MKRLLILFLGLIIFSFTACEKEPGPGGKASIQGKILVHEKSANCEGPANPTDPYYGIDEEIYLVFGDDPGYSERERTGINGTYWFPNLKKGKYKVYALSDNCDPYSDEKEIVLYELEITDKKQDFVVPDLHVIRN